MIIQQNHKASLAILAISTMSFISFTSPTIAAPVFKDRFNAPTRIQSIPRSQMVGRNVVITGMISPGATLQERVLPCSFIKVLFQEHIGSQFKTIASGTANGSWLSKDSSCAYSLNLRQPLTSLAVEPRTFTLRIQSDVFAPQGYTMDITRQYATQSHLPDTLNLDTLGEVFPTQPIP